MRTELLESLKGIPLAIDERRLNFMLAKIDAGHEAALQRMPQPRREGKVAVVPIRGYIAHRMDWLMEMFGGTSTEDLGRTIDQLAADESIKQVVLDIDSPGGSVYGVQELADKLFALREKKNMYAVANPLAASAAYWLGSQASEFSITPSGEAGSIGVIAVHTDVSGLEGNLGVKRTIIKSGRYKGAGNPYEPLSDETRQQFQSDLDEYYGAFVSAVARGRRTNRSAVRNGYGEGRALGARRALEENLVDRIATLDEVLSGLGVRMNTGTKRAEDLSLVKAKATLAAMST